MASATSARSNVSIMMSISVLDVQTTTSPTFETLAGLTRGSKHALTFVVSQGEGLVDRDQIRCSGRRNAWQGT